MCHPTNGVWKFPENLASGRYFQAFPIYQTGRLEMYTLDSFNYEGERILIYLLEILILFSLYCLCVLFAGLSFAFLFTFFL